MTHIAPDIEKKQSALNNKISEREKQIAERERLLSLLKPDFSNLDDIDDKLALCDDKIKQLESEINDLNICVAQKCIHLPPKDTKPEAKETQKKYYLKTVWEKIDKQLANSLNLKTKVVQEVLDLNIDDIPYPEIPKTCKVKNVFNKEGLHILAQGVDKYHDRRRMLHGVAFLEKIIVCEAYFADHLGKDKPEYDNKRDELNSTSLNEKYAKIKTDDGDYWDAKSLLSWISTAQALGQKINDSKPSHTH